MYHIVVTLTLKGCTLTQFTSNIERYCKQSVVIATAAATKTIGTSNVAIVSKQNAQTGTALNVKISVYAGTNKQDAQSVGNALNEALQYPQGLFCQTFKNLLALAVGNNEIKSNAFPLSAVESTGSEMQSQPVASDSDSTTLVIIVVVIVVVLLLGLCVALWYTFCRGSAGKAQGSDLEASEVAPTWSAPTMGNNTELQDLDQKAELEKDLGEPGVDSPAINDAMIQI